MIRFRSRPVLNELETRVAPAVLLHSLFPDTAGPQAGGNFGTSVAVGSNYRVVGADVDVSGLVAVGQAYVYDSVNTLVAVLNNPSPAAEDHFGHSVAVSGNVVVVGAHRDETGMLYGAGSAYVYDLTSTTPTAPIATLNNPSPWYEDYFGYSASVSGNYVVVGSYGNDTGGSAYVYDLSSLNPTVPVATLNNPIPAGEDYFGYSVSVTGNTVVVGAYNDDTGATAAGSAYVFDLSSMTPTVPIATLNNPSPAANDNFGQSVSVSSNYVVVGSYADDTGATDAGSAYVYDLSSMTPTVPIATLHNPSPTAADYFGISVAVSGNTVVVGAYADDTGASDTGSAYVYDLSSPTPTVPISTLNNPSPGVDDLIGNTVAVSGNTVVVGAIYDDTGATGTGATDTGSAFVYDLSSPTPTVPIAILNNPSPAVGDQFGSAVSVSGTYMVVGVGGDDTGGENAGATYVYDLSSLTPTVPVAILNNPSPTAADYFGVSVAVSGDFVVVGASGDDTGATNAGAAYVYDLSSMTPTVPVATLNNPSPADNEQFGISVAVSGNTLVVGASEDITGATAAGSAYVYNLSSITPTVPIATLNNPSPAPFDRFGGTVRVTGNTVVVGAAYDNTGATAAGSAYVYDLSLMTPTVPIATLNNPSPAPYEFFGAWLSVSGTTVVAGSRFDDAGAEDAGTAYVYDLSSMTPTVPIATLNNPSPAAIDYFGFSVSVSGNTVVVGAPGDRTGAPFAGSAYVYDLSSPNPTAPIATINNPSPAFDDLFGYSVAVSGNTAVVGAYRDDTQNTDQGAVYVYTLAPAKVAAVRINDGSAQRSRVTSVAVTFDQPVSFAGLPAAAFQLRRLSDNAIVNLAASVNNTGPGTVVTLTFTGGAVEFGSLADGRYTLTIDSAQVSNANGALDGNADAAAGGNYTFGDTQGLFRYYGDMNGDRRVDISDFGYFSLAYLQTANYNAALDFNNDGRIDIADFGQFSVRFFTTLP